MSELNTYVSALTANGGNISAAARSLNMSRTTFRRRLKQLAPSTPSHLIQEYRNHKPQDVVSSAPSNETSKLLAQLIEAQSLQAQLLQQVLSNQLAAEPPGKPDAAAYEAPYVRACESSPNERILIISDLHAPYQHPDAIQFLSALKEKYDFDRIICVGDELDYHAMSYHESDPDLMSASDELKAGREVLWELEKLFPEMDLVDSNHGSMAYRRQKTAGMPRHLIHSYRDIVFGSWEKDGLERATERGRGWVWHPTLTIDVPNNKAPLYIAHGIATDARNAMRRTHTNVAQGHYHTELHIRYESGPQLGGLWGITAGCLIDDASLAFAYNKTTPARPSIGCAGVLSGVPVLFPMLRDENNRWTGVVP